MLVVSSVAIAIVANWLRVTVMGVYAQAGGKDLHGPYHILQGLLVDWIAFAFLFAGAWLLGRVEHADPLPSVHVDRNRLTHEVLAHWPTWNRAWWVACVTLSFATLVLYQLDRGASGLTKDLATFPGVIGDWAVDHQPNSASRVDLRAADASLSRTYRASDGRRVQLSVAYRKSQRQGQELVGQETAPLHTEATATMVGTGNDAIPMNRTVLRNRGRAVPALFWYHIDGRGYTDPVHAKLATVKQALLHGRTDGALVLVGLVGDLESTLSTVPLILGRRSVAGSLIGGIAETQEMLDFCGQHGIASDIEVIGIQDINEAYERLLKADVKYRFVIDMASLRAMKQEVAA